jgi:hypothetical protein
MKQIPASKTYADAIVALHFVWTVFVLGGTIAVIFDHAYAWVNAVVLLITLAVNMPLKNNCPLTLLEEKLRRVHDPEYRNNGSFMATYLNKIFRTNITTNGANNVIAVFYTCATILTFYALLHP